MERSEVVLCTSSYACWFRTKQLAIGLNVSSIGNASSGRPLPHTLHNVAYARADSDALVAHQGNFPSLVIVSTYGEKRANRAYAALAKNCAITKSYGTESDTGQAARDMCS